MKTFILALFCCVALCAYATKPKNIDYQDAVLKSFRIVDGGQVCSSSTYSAPGSSTAQTSTTCSPRGTALYTIAIGDQLIVLSPTHSTGAKTGAVLSLGWGALFWKNSCLYGQLPGAHIQIRGGDGGVYHVKVGKKESLYKLEAADAR